MNNVDFTKIGNLIRLLRNERSLTIDQLATYIGVSKPAISQWENGKGIKTEYLYSLARFFNITVDELVVGKRNGESNNDFIKRNYDLSIYDFNESKCDDKTGEEYLFCLKQIRNRFFALLKEWTLNELKDNAKEEFEFLKQYFEVDSNYLSYLNGHLVFFGEKGIKETIKNRIESMPSCEEKEIDWELQKFYSLKQDFLKTNLICNTKSNYLLGKLLEVMIQPQKDILLAINLVKEVTKIQNDGFHDMEMKSYRPLTIDEIEQTLYLKTMLNCGCNVMKEFNLGHTYLDKEDFGHFEDKPICTIESMSLNDDTRPYSKEFGDKNLVGSLQYWKIYSYEQYLSFVDTKKTEYYKAVVNFKNDNPSKYYEALKKYYRGN